MFKGLRPKRNRHEANGGTQNYLQLMYENESTWPMQTVIFILVGGLEHEFHDFPFSWECHNPS